MFLKKIKKIFFKEGPKDYFSANKWSKLPTSDLGKTGCDIYAKDYFEYHAVIYVWKKDALLTVKDGVNHKSFKFKTGEQAVSYFRTYFQLGF